MIRLHEDIDVYVSLLINAYNGHHRPELDHKDALDIAELLRELQQWRNGEKRYVECTCETDSECIPCGEKDCPHGEPLHYHHDGCPACFEDEEEAKQ